MRVNRCALERHYRSHIHIYNANLANGNHAPQSNVLILTRGSLGLMRRSLLQAVQPRPWRALSTITSSAVDTDVVVIGAGVVGLAAGRALANSGREVMVLDAGPTVGTETSSRNSEVIHAGNLNLN